MIDEMYYARDACYGLAWWVAELRTQARAEFGDAIPTDNVITVLQWIENDLVRIGKGDVGEADLIG